MDLSKTICFENNIYGENYYFCGDDLYGNYTKEEFIELRSAIWHRMTEVLEHHFRFGEK